MTLPLVNLDHIDLLGADLAAAGYDAEAVPELLGESAHRELGRGHRWPALHVTAADDSPLAILTRLFLLGTSETTAAVARALPSLGAAPVIIAGVVEHDPNSDDELLRAALDIRPHADNTRSYLVVSDLDSDLRPGPLRADHVLGIGAASLQLARAVVRDPAARVLDLGTGCGIQALHCHSHAGQIVATDTNPRALALAAATARLNGMTWDLRLGSLFEPVAGERFDLIVSNPPFVISPGVARFEYRDSGMTGDEICRRLVTELPAYLNPGGTAQLLANWLIHEDQDWRLRVGEWVAETGLDGWVVQRDVADPAQYVSMWLADAGEEIDMDNRDSKAAIAREWLAYFERENVTGIGMGTITLRRPPAARTTPPDVVFDELTGAGDELTGPEVSAFLARRQYLAEQTDEGLLATRFSQAATNLLQQQLVPSPEGFTPVLRLLYRPGGPGASVQLDEWGQSLLAGCTGAAPLRLLIDLLAQAHRIDPAALTAAVLPTIRTAITRGLIHPVEE